MDKKHPDLDEEFITRLFYDEFAFLLSEDSEKARLEMRSQVICMQHSQN